MTLGYWDDALIIQHSVVKYERNKSDREAFICLQHIDFCSCHRIHFTRHRRTCF